MINLNVKATWNMVGWEREEDHEPDCHILDKMESLVSSVDDSMKRHRRQHSRMAEISKGQILFGL